jgi:PAS domain-containing protein
MKSDEKAEGVPARGTRRARSSKPAKARSMRGGPPGHAGSFGIRAEDMSLTRMLEALEPHDHLCLIYESPKEWRAAAVPFIAIGLQRGQKCVYIVDTSTAAEIRRYLGEEGVDVATAEQSGQLSILHESEAYTRDGSFDPDRMIALLISETEKAVAEGYPALRSTGEMTWMLRGLRGSERLLEYEAKLNRDFFPQYPCLGICQYDRWKFDPELIKGVILTHPILVRGNNIYRNFYYIPPEEFLNAKRADMEVQHWLNNLARQKVERQKLAESEDNFRNSLDESPLGIRVVSAEGETLYANRAILDIYGYDSIEEMEATPSKKRYTPESYAKHRERVEKRQQGEYVPPNYPTMK